MGVAIAEHVAAGRNTHVLWLTSGGGTGARNQINGDGTNAWWKVPHVPAAEGYDPLSLEDCAAARIREARNAIAALATPGTVGCHEAGIVGAVTQAGATAAILAVADQIAPGAAVHVKTTSWLVDDHADHLAAGNAVKALAASGTRFADPRYYVLPPYWTDSRLSQVSEVWDNPTDASIAQRVRNACRCYAAWSPPNTYAIGYHSTSSYFAQIDISPKSMLHL